MDAAVGVNVAIVLSYVNAAVVVWVAAAVVAQVVAQVVAAVVATSVFVSDVSLLSVTFEGDLSAEFASSKLPNINPKGTAVTAIKTARHNETESAMRSAF